MDLHLYLEEDMESAGELRLASGTVAVQSAGCPGYEGPNEDGALVASLRGGGLVLALADGAGGGPAGEAAAALSLRLLADRLAGFKNGSMRETVLSSIEAAHEKVIGMGGAGTTFLVVEVREGQLRAYNVGDSGALVVGQRGKHKFQTIAHSPTGFAVAAGVMKEKEALHHEERHLVSNLLGAPDMRVEVSQRLPLASKDTVLLASDGLFDNVSQAEIVERIRKGPLSRAARSLFQLARHRMGSESETQPSKPDDLTVVLFRRKPPRRSRPLRPKS